MKPLKKIAGINLAVLFAYSILIRVVSSGDEHGASMAILITSAFAVGIHVLICLVVTAIEFGNKDKGLGRAWLLSSGIVLLVGFSTCLGNASL
jgi:threonine/homoserine/homoserine lactone efflux protein